MKKLSALIIISASVITVIVLMTGCTGTFGSPVNGNGKIETQSFNNTGFNRLEIDNAFQADVTYSGSFAVSITADSNLFSYLDIRQSGGTLHVGLQKNHSYLNTTQKASITLPDLQDIKVSGAAKTQVTGFNSTNALNIDISGAGRLSFTDVKIGSAAIKVSGAGITSGTLSMMDGNFNISGASILELTGTADNITADISGASSGRLENLILGQSTLTVSGASNATVSVSGRLNVNVSGASRVYYTGAPTLGSINVTGASTFAKKP
jgi:hypothetical protein